jgi:two-component system LytT family response regulator
MKAVLVDDEKLSLLTLQKVLEKHCPDVEIIGSYQKPADGLAALLHDKPDLLFLDIEMPAMNGFDLLEAIEEPDFDVIFTTAYNEYALRAIKVSAMDYLLKPIDESELMAAVEKIRQKRANRMSQQHMELLLTNLSIDNAFPKLAIPSLDGIEFVDVENILHCEADRNYTIIYTVSGEHFIFSKTLKEIEKLLPERDFFRTHQSHLINLRHIKKYIRGTGGEIVLSDGKHIRVAKVKKEALMERIFKRS